MNIQSYEKAFNSVRKFGFATIIGNFIVSVTCIGIVSYVFLMNQERVVVVTPGGTAIGYSNYNHETSLSEMRNHISYFTQHCFQYDAPTYKKNIVKAFKLIAQKDADIIYNNFKELEIYEKLVRTGGHYTVAIDRIVVNGNSYPYKGEVYLRQTCYTATGVNSIGIGLKFDISARSRTDENPFGLELENIKFYKYNGEYSAVKQEPILIEPEPQDSTATQAAQ